MNPETGMGSKIVTDDFESETGEKLAESLAESSYSYHEVVLSANPDVDREVILTNRQNKLVHLLLPPASAIKTSATNSLTLTLNGNLSYYIAFVDPTFSLVTANPKTIPQTLLKVEPNAGAILIYLEVWLHSNKDM